MPDSTTNPNLSNPQALVDAALGGGAPNNVAKAQPTQDPATNIDVELANPVGATDELPLAFATQTQVETTPTKNNEQITSMNSNLPPTAPLPPLPTPPSEPKQKGKLGVAVGGILLLFITLGGGVWGYGMFSNNKSKTPQVAVITDQCKKECKESGKSEVQCRNECQPETKPNTDYTPPSNVKEGEFGYKYPGGDIAGTYRCGENNSRLCLVDSPGTLEAAAEFCKANDTLCKNTLNFTDAVRQKIEEAKSGLTPCAPGDSCPAQCTLSQLSSWKQTNEPGGGKYCDDQGRECRKYRIERMEVAGGAHCFVGYDEQCGEPGQCGPGTNSPRPSPSPSPVSTMACTGLTQSPSSNLTIGTKLTFTCTGSVNPTNAGTLSYKFRYSINNGVLTTLANKTPTTAELTIASCGSYLVECQACTNLSGVVKCDPIWTGATQ